MVAAHGSQMPCPRAANNLSLTMALLGRAASFSMAKARCTVFRSFSSFPSCSKKKLKPNGSILLWRSRLSPVGVMPPVNLKLLNGGSSRRCALSQAAGLDSAVEVEVVAEKMPSQAVIVPPTFEQQATQRLQELSDLGVVHNMNDYWASVGCAVMQSSNTEFSMDAKTGAFQHLPMVSPAYEILGSALRKARMVRPTKGIMNVAKRERNRGAKQLDALIKELALPLKMYLQKFPRRQVLHAYERALLELTLGEGKYEEVLERVDYLRKKVLDLGKNWASLCAKSTTKLEAEERLAEGFTKLEEVFNRYGKAVDDLKEHAKKLRAMPVISLRTPTLCLVGAPNVGKSSLVRILSSGKPEICNYQFTTRGISIGHFEVDSRRFQVTDTPGLLERPDEERNNIEKLTLAALSHLPTSILYVHDLTEECGSSAAKQYKIYKEIKGRYSDRPWLDVVSKADLLSPPPSRSRSLDKDSGDSYVQCGPSGAIWVSVETGEGVDELEQRVHALLVKAHPDESKDEDSTWEKAQKHDADAKPVEEFYYPAWPRKQEN